MFLLYLFHDLKVVAMMGLPATQARPGDVSPGRIIKQDILSCKIEKPGTILGTFPTFFLALRLPAWSVYSQSPAEKYVRYKDFHAFPK